MVGELGRSLSMKDRGAENTAGQYPQDWAYGNRAEKWAVDEDGAIEAAGAVVGNVKQDRTPAPVTPVCGVMRYQMAELRLLKPEALGLGRFPARGAGAAGAADAVDVVFRHVGQFES
jgi:hypothetical protein